MKKIVLSFVCVFITCMVSHAQGVKFESGTWEEILTKAKTENKKDFSGKLSMGLQFLYNGRYIKQGTTKKQPKNGI